VPAATTETAAVPAAAPCLNPPPAGFVDLCVGHPGIRCAVAYSTADNFTGAPLPGYGAAAAWLLAEPAAALDRVAASLAGRSIGLLVYDGYRPVRGTLAMVAWAERSGHPDLLQGYIARRSGHNHGHTVDLTLLDLAAGEPFDMGCPFDTLDERARTRNSTGEVLARRLLLVDAMRAQGFRNYSEEWWHYGYAVEGTVPRDVPYGCDEAPEGAWAAPEGWERPGWEPTAASTPR
jgi:D-alanyl-D-alanine dipeptidase